MPCNLISLWQDSVPICLRNRPCASTVLPYTIDKLIAPLCLLLRYWLYRYACNLPTRFRADLPTNTTLLLALYCHLNNPIAGTVLLPTQTIIVPICIRYIDQPIAPIRLLSRPDRTIVPMCLRSTDQMIVLIRLRSTDRMIVLIRLRSTDRMIVPIRLQLTNRLVDKLYAWPLSLLSLVPYYHLDRPLPCLQLILI